MNSARRTVTFAIAELDDDDGLLTAAATIASETTYEPGVSGGYDGAALDATFSYWNKLPRTITITRSSAVGSYTTDPIVLSGFRNGSAVTESLTPGDADGGDQLRGTQAFDFPPTIVVPAQVDTSGQFEIGCGNICARGGEVFVAVKFRGTAGQMNVQYGEATDSHTDSFALGADDMEPIAPSRILTSDALSSPTAQILTVYCQS
jgi:hypothetical protein